MQVFGIALAHPLAIPECSAATVRSVCFDRAGIYRGIGARGSCDPITTAQVAVRFPPLELPVYVRDSSVLAEVIDGQVESLTFYTTGVTNQGQVLDELIAKFGKPTSSSTRPMQTRGGAKFDSAVAIWSLPGVGVSFAGTIGSVDRGVVIISTPKGDQASKARRDDMARQQRPL